MTTSRTTTEPWTATGGLALLLTACHPPGPSGTTDAQPPEPSATAEHAPTPGGLTPVPLPAWVGFPADPQALQHAIDARQPQELRAHAWTLWAGLEQPISADDAWPVWWTWSTTTQLFEEPIPAAEALTPMSRHRHAARELARRALAASEGPAAAPDASVDHTDECFDDQGKGVIFFPSPTYVLPSDLVAKAGLDPACAEPKHAAQPGSGCSLSDGEHFQNNGDILVATESYSPQGADRIVAKGYDQAAVLDALRAEGTTMLPDLATEQVTTKHMMWPVKAEGLSALPVHRDLPRSQWCQYNGYETWDAMVAVDPEASTRGKGEVDFLFGVWNHAGTEVLPTKHASVEVVPMSELYWWHVDEAAWAALADEDRLILDAASRWAHGKPFEPGDYVVAVASHIITKEIPQWTLQSAWWSDRPNEGPYAADRPSLPEAQGPWDHYLMTIAYGIPTEPGGSVLPIAYNPYIELAATHPVATNCRNCHLRAGWTNADSSYLVPTGPGPLANIGPSDPIFEGLLLTDFQWVISDRVKPASP